jgi:hypothetical protein
VQRSEMERQFQSYSSSFKNNKHHSQHMKENLNVFITTSTYQPSWFLSSTFYFIGFFFFFVIIHCSYSVLIMVEMTETSTSILTVESSCKCYRSEVILPIGNFLQYSIQWNKKKILKFQHGCLNCMYNFSKSGLK